MSEDRKWEGTASLIGMAGTSPAMTAEGSGTDKAPAPRLDSAQVGPYFPPVFAIDVKFSPAARSLRGRRQPPDSAMRPRAQTCFAAPLQLSPAGRGRSEGEA